jgi:hypothetical protein
MRHLSRAATAGDRGGYRGRELVSTLPDQMKPFTNFLRPIVLEKKPTDDVEGDATFLARRRRRRGRKFMYVIFGPRAYRAP